MKNVKCAIDECRAKAMIIISSKGGPKQQYCHRHGEDAIFAIGTLAYDLIEPSELSFGFVSPVSEVKNELI